MIRVQQALRLNQLFLLRWLHTTETTGRLGNVKTYQVDTGGFEWLSSNIFGLLIGWHLPVVATSRVLANEFSNFCFY